MADTTKPPRKTVPAKNEKAVLIKSARRCPLCFHLNGDLTEKIGQIAHLDGDPTNGAEDNLAWMCMPHHSVYDSTTSQHKNYTIAEVKELRSKLYEAIARGERGAVEPHPLIFHAQFAEMKELEEFLGGKEEMALRVTFDIPNMLTRNIDILKIKIEFIRAGRWKEFQYEPFLEGNREMVFWAKEGKYSTGPSGVHIDAEPHDVLVLVTTTKHQNAKLKLVKFINSALLPATLKKEVTLLNENINNNIELMIRILDEKMHQDENHFLRNLDTNSQNYGVIVSEYAVRISPIKPAADRVLAVIAERWRTNH